MRFWLQDTDVNNALFQDQELQYFIALLTPANGGDPVLVAAYCCTVLTARYAGEVSITADGVTYSGEQLQQKYADLAASLRQQYESLRALGGIPYGGGIARGDHPEPGTRPLNFGVGMDDNPLAGRQNDGHFDHAEWHP